MRRGHGKYRVAAREDRTADGILFASKAEMIRYQELKFAKRAGIIREFGLQPKYQLTRHVSYTPDFFVVDADGEKHVEDVKGVRTAAFGIKARLWREFGPCPLVILKRRGTTWERKEVEGA